VEFFSPSFFSHFLSLAVNPTDNNSKIRTIKQISLARVRFLGQTTENGPSEVLR